MEDLALVALVVCLIFVSLLASSCASSLFGAKPTSSKAPSRQVEDLPKELDASGDLEDDWGAVDEDIDDDDGADEEETWLQVERNLKS